MAYDSRHRLSFLFGGFDGGNFLSDTWQFDGTAWTQLQVAGPQGRWLAPMVYDSSREVSVMFGGAGAPGFLSDTWEWNGSTWTPKFTFDTPPSREWAAMAYDSVRHVTLLFGGLGGNGLLNDTWEYDGNDWKQVTTTQSPPARRGQTMAFDATRGVTVLFGGQGSVNLNDTWEFNGTNWTQIMTSTAPTPRLFQAMAYDPNLGATVLFGGDASSGLAGDTWLYDGSNWQQLATLSAPSGRFWAASDYDATRGAVVLFGGSVSPGPGPLFNDTWSLQGAATSPPNWAQANVSSGPQPRVFAAMDYDSARGVSVLFSGSSDGGPGNLQDTWEWNGSSWLQRTPASSPPALAAASMAYDSARGVSVLFGGDGAAGVSSSTWEWNGASWSQKTFSPAPAARVWASTAYDSAHARMVLFGGSGATGLLNDTWLYDGNNWTQIFPATPPSPRLGAAMAFDPVRGNIVLFGGRDSSGQRLADTWELVGNNWTQVAMSTSPYARFWSTMAFDAQLGKTVLFGGDHIQPFALGEENDTWEWDGSQWTREWTAAAPPVRAGHSMTYDLSRGRMVMFGGFNPATSPGTFYADTWELSGVIRTPAGTPNATASPSNLNFGSANVGSTSFVAAVALTSSGTGPLTIISIATTGDFSVVSSDCPTASDPFAAGSYCYTLVSFTPTAQGARSGTLTFNDNAAGGSQIVPLQGNGVLIQTSLTVTPVTALFNTSATFTATLAANGSPAAGQPVMFKLPTGTTTTVQTNSQGIASWAGASLSGIHVGSYPAGVQASFAGASGFASSTASAGLTITQPVSMSYTGDFFVADTIGPRIAVTVDQRTAASDPQFLDYSATAVWARFTVAGPTGSSDFYARVADAPDWTTSGLGVASLAIPALQDGAYTVIATLVDGSGSTTLSSAVAGDDVRVGLVSSPTKGGFASGGGAIEADPSANTADTHGYFSFQVKPGSASQGNLVYVYRVRMDVGGGNLRDVDVWVTSADVTSLEGNSSSATVMGHFSVAYVDAQTGQRYSGFEFGGGTFKLSAVNVTGKDPAGFSLVLKRPDGTIFHASAPTNPSGGDPPVAVVLGSLLCNL